MRRLCGMTVLAGALALSASLLSTDVWAQTALSRLSSEWLYFG